MTPICRCSISRNEVYFILRWFTFHFFNHVSYRVAKRQMSKFEDSLVRTYDVAPLHELVLTDTIVRCQSFRCVREMFQWKTNDNWATATVKVKEWKLQRVILEWCIWIQVIHFYYFFLFHFLLFKSCVCVCVSLLKKPTSV